MKKVMITGAGQGIGRAIASAFAGRGFRVVAVDINAETARKTAEDLKGEYFIADVSRLEQLETLAEKHPNVDILVNNAGILHTTPIEDITEAEWDRIMDVNLKGAFFLTQKLLPHMKKQRWGRIINISSLAGRMGGYANGVVYSISKAGLLGMTTALARRLAPFNITVNAVAPGTTESDILAKIPPEQIEALKETIPLKRLGRPENVAETVFFLASDGADFITGATIDVNGGIYS